MSAGVRAWRRSIAVGLAIACLAIAGCSDDDDDQPNDSGLPSGGDSASATNPSVSGPTGSSETPPTLPPNIDNTSPAAAKAFARHVVDLINYAKTNFDVEPLRQVFGDGCEICTNGLDNTQQLADDGARVEGGKWSVDFLRYVPERPRTEPLLDIVINVTRERVFRPGAMPEVNPAFQDNYSWLLNHTDAGGWKLTDWTFVE